MLIYNALVENGYQLVAGVKGLEPSTYRVTGDRSNQLSYTPTNGGRYRTRTYDPLNVNQMLYQLS